MGFLVCIFLTFFNHLYFPQSAIIIVRRGLSFRFAGILTCGKEKANGN